MSIISVVCVQYVDSIANGSMSMLIVSIQNVNVISIEHAQCDYYVTPGNSLANESIEHAQCDCYYYITLVTH